MIKAEVLRELSKLHRTESLFPSQFVIFVSWIFEAGESVLSSMFDRIFEGYSDCSEFGFWYFSAESHGSYNKFLLYFYFENSQCISVAIEQE